MSILFIIGLSIWMMGFGISHFTASPTGPLFHIVGGALVLLSAFVAV